MEGKCENGRMRIAILHHELEWAEKQFQKEFVRRGQICHLFDVRNVNSTEELSEYDLVMNRVYPSLVADEGTYNDSIKTVRLLEELEGQGVRTFNSCKTTMADYSKFYSSSLMNEADVRNPATILVNDEYDIGRALKFSRKKGFPLIVKRDIGGRGKDVKKVNGGDALKDILGTMLSPKYRSSYNGGIVVQEYLKSERDHDCRIAVLNNRFVFSFRRSLISTDENDEPWLASVSRGSRKEHYEPSEEEIELAKRATNSIGAFYNEVDMVFTKKGLAIIENNPTPNYVCGQDEGKVNAAVDMLVGNFEAMDQVAPAPAYNGFAPVPAPAYRRFMPLPTYN